MNYINYVIEEKFNILNKKYLYQEDLFFEFNYNIYIFYYVWYGNLEYDGKYVYWNYRFFFYWNFDIVKCYRKGFYIFFDDIGFNFYFVLGFYSLKDLVVIVDYMR